MLYSSGNASNIYYVQRVYNILLEQNSLERDLPCWLSKSDAFSSQFEANKRRASAFCN